MVVGPNGSGKSNLADAVAWVMGTQSTRALRTQRMEDVIFAGTATRPAMGRAEVTLLFDNSLRRLPLDLEEVSVTRRLYRDGSSDYLINGVECRLLDVQELLSDGGVGRHQHVIVGQGQLETILNAKPEDHRALIEEAAGILKHRLRKERALRRLERTDTDVLRLGDLVAELKRRLRPLRRQAAAAERYEGVVAEIRALRLFLAGEGLRRIRSRLERARGTRDGRRRSLEEARAELTAVERALRQLTGAAGAAAAALERDSAAAARLETTAERLRRVAQVARERRKAAEVLRADAGERRRELEEQCRSLQTELAAGAAREAEARREAERSERLLLALEEEERSLSSQQALPVEGAAAMVRGDLAALEAAAAREGREATDVARRLEVLQDELARQAAEVDRVQREIRVLDGQTSELRRAFEDARAIREQEQVRWEEAEQHVWRARLEEAKASARLEALQEANEGSTVLERVTASSGVSGSLLAALDVPAELSGAVAAALGSWTGALLVRSPEALTTLVGELKSEALGGISLVAAGAPERQREARRVAAHFGVETLADSLGPAADRSLATALLGDVVVAEEWSIAWKVAREYPEVRVVTPEGDLVEAVGIKLSPPQGPPAAAANAASVAREAAAVARARAESLMTSGRRDFETARRRERETLEALEASEARLAGAVEGFDRLERARAGVRREAEVLEDRGGALQAEAVRRQEQMDRLRHRLQTLEGDGGQPLPAWEEVERRRREVASDRERAAGERQAAAAALGAVAERRTMLEQQLQGVRSELQQLGDRPSDPSSLQRLATVAAAAGEVLEVVRSHIRRLRERQAELREVAEDAGARLAATRARHEALRDGIAATKDHLAELDVEIAELEVRDESIAEGLRRDADASDGEALAAPRPDLEDGETPDDRLATREAELRRMGTINPLAAEEHRSLAERHEFLQGQLDDLTRSRNELRKVIRALDEEIVDIFGRAFEEVSRHFEKHFSILFPGGRGRLRLTAPEDKLATGVEIEAQPLGKRLSRISLLSGGEQSLASLAFLFSIFEARPSPFYVLDEVDAALDDANLRRFLRLVDQFRRRAQLVIVTHQQQTMEAADVLHGVTMEPGGSSQVLVKRMSDVAAGATP